MKEPQVCCWFSPRKEIDVVAIRSLEQTMVVLYAYNFQNLNTVVCPFYSG